MLAKLKVIHISAKTVSPAIDVVHSSYHHLNLDRKHSIALQMLWLNSGATKTDKYDIFRAGAAARTAQ